MRSLSVLLTSLCLVIYVGLLASCGSTSSNSNAGNTNNPSTGTPGSGSGSGSGSGGSGSAGSGSGSGGSGSSGSGSGGSGSSYVAFAYAATTSAIAGYGMNSDGSLTALAGSPYAASLAQNANIVTNGANLYTIANGETNLDVFSIDKSSGALTLADTTNAVAGAPQGDIAFHVALDHTGASLYEAVGTNIDGGVNVFAVGSSSNAQQVQYLAGPSTPLAPEVFSPNNQFGYTWNCGARVEGIFAWQRASDGTLKEIIINPGAIQRPTGSPGEAFCPHGLAVSAKGYLAVLWIPFGYASSGPIGNETYVMTYVLNSDGSLTSISNSQVKTASTSANKVAVNFDPSGSFLAVAGDGGVQALAMNANGILSPVGSPQSPGANFQGVAWDNSNHVFAGNSNQLYVFNSSTGVLTPASGSPYAGGPELAVFPLK